MSLFINKFTEKPVRKYIKDNLWLTCNLFDDYKYLEYYDEGGYSSLHKIMSLNNGKHLILKRSIKKDFISGKLESFLNTEKTLRINEKIQHEKIDTSQEAEFMVKVNKNLKGLKLYDYYDHENYYILVMEYGGRSLENLVTSHKKKILNLLRHNNHISNYFYSTYLMQVKLYMIKVYFEIKKIHNLGIHHNDLKLENILINDEGKINIIDFGVSKYIEPFYNDYKGTLEYIPYEFIKFGTYKPWNHTLWCFGIMLHYLTLMKYPFLKEEDVLNYNLDIDEIQKLPSSFSKLILNCLDKEPENRPRNLLEKLGNLHV